MSFYHHLTIEERETVYLMKHDHFSINTIAKTLHRAPSTILRELRRNGVSSYSPSKAQNRYQQHKTHCGRKKILSNLLIFQTVKKLFLIEQWSPEEISARLAMENYTPTISY